ncbi:MAG: AAA family ATPase [Endomicrobia bacterium]|nr:AAA family ATPase [Endomicrobiia bacterium]
MQIGSYAQGIIAVNKADKPTLYDFGDTLEELLVADKFYIRDKPFGEPTLYDFVDTLKELLAAAKVSIRDSESKVYDTPSNLFPLKEKTGFMSIHQLGLIQELRRIFNMKSEDAKTDLINGNFPREQMKALMKALIRELEKQYPKIEFRAVEDVFYEWEHEWARDRTEFYAHSIKYVRRRYVVNFNENKEAVNLQSASYASEKLQFGNLSNPVFNADLKNERTVKLFFDSEGQERIDLTANIELPETVYYQIGDGKTEAFTFTPKNKENLAEMLAIYSKPNADAKNSNIWLEGPRGAGKNTLSFVMAGLLGVPIRFVNLHANTTQKDIAERVVLTRNGKKTITLPDGTTAEIPATATETLFSEIYQAAMNGELVIIDEADKIKLDGVLSALNAVLTRRKLEGFEYKPDFRVIVLSNSHEGGDVAGKDLTQKAADFISRLNKITVDYLTAEEEYNLVVSQVFGNKEFPDSVKIALDIVIKIAAETRKAVQDKQISRVLSTRGIIRIARHLEKYPEDADDLESLIDKAYGTGSLDGKSRKIFKGILTKMLPAGIVTKSVFGESLDFSFEEENGIIYCIMGAVRVKTGHTKIEDARAVLEKNQNLKLNANMPLFYQWMKDISLGNNIMVLGVPGTGKTVLTNYLINGILGLNSPHYLQVMAQTTGTELLGTWMVKNEEQIFVPSPVIEAMLEGKPIFLDEIDKAGDPTALAALNNIAQSGFVTLPDDTAVYAKEGFFIAAAGNLSTKGGTASTRISGEVLDRYSSYILEPLGKGNAVEMLKKYLEEVAEYNGKVSGELINAFVDFHYAIMNDDGITDKPTMRTLEKALGSIAVNPERLKDIVNLYFEGYSVRSEIEKYKICDKFKFEINALKVAAVENLQKMFAPSGLNMPEGIFRKLAQFRNLLEQEWEIELTEEEWFGFLEKVLKNKDTPVAFLDLALKTFGINKGEDINKMITVSFYETFIDEILSDKLEEKYAAMFKTAYNDFISFEHIDIDEAFSRVQLINYCMDLINSGRTDELFLNLKSYIDKEKHEQSRESLSKLFDVEMHDEISFRAKELGFNIGKEMLDNVRQFYENFPEFKGFKHLDKLLRIINDKETNLIFDRIILEDGADTSLKILNGKKKKIEQIFGVQKNLYDRLKEISETLNYDGINDEMLNKIFGLVIALEYTPDILVLANKDKHEEFYKVLKAINDGDLHLITDILAKALPEYKDFDEFPGRSAVRWELTGDNYKNYYLEENKNYVEWAKRAEFIEKTVFKAFNVRQEQKELEKREFAKELLSKVDLGNRFSIKSDAKHILETCLHKIQPEEPYAVAEMNHGVIKLLEYLNARKKMRDMNLSEDFSLLPLYFSMNFFESTDEKKFDGERYDYWVKTLANYYGEPETIFLSSKQAEIISTVYGSLSSGFQQDVNYKRLLDILNGDPGEIMREILLDFNLSDLALFKGNRSKQAGTVFLTYARSEINQLEQTISSFYGKQSIKNVNVEILRQYYYRFIITEVKEIDNLESLDKLIAIGRPDLVLLQLLLKDIIPKYKNQAGSLKRLEDFYNSIELIFGRQSNDSQSMARLIALNFDDLPSEKELEKLYNNANKSGMALDFTDIKETLRKNWRQYKTNSQPFFNFTVDSADENGNILTTISLPDSPENLEIAKKNNMKHSIEFNKLSGTSYNLTDVPVRKLPYKIGGAGLFAGIVNGQLIFFSEGDLEQVQREIKIMLSDHGNIKASKRLRAELKKLFKSAGIKIDMAELVLNLTQDLPQGAVSNYDISEISKDSSELSADEIIRELSGKYIKLSMIPTQEAQTQSLIILQLLKDDQPQNLEIRQKMSGFSQTANILYAS